MRIVSFENLAYLFVANIVKVASKFFEHFILISDAMTFRAGGKEKSLWNDEDG